MLTVIIQTKALTVRVRIKILQLTLLGVKWCGDTLKNGVFLAPLQCNYKKEGCKNYWKMPLLQCKDASGNCNPKASIIVKCSRGTKLKLIWTRGKSSTVGDRITTVLTTPTMVLSSEHCPTKWDSSFDDTWCIQAAQAATSKKERPF
jgi:hypothetical protein